MSKTNREKIIVVMPTYNEAENIEDMIKVLKDDIFLKIDSVEMHLLVVDDNSPDNTGKLVQKYAKKYKNIHLLSGRKQGLGYAYARGMRFAMSELGADAVVEMDADFQHNPKYLIPMVKAYTEGADYVIGSRYVQKGGIPKEWEFYRRAISYFGNLFARIVLWLPELHDITTGFRLTRVKGVLDKIKLDKLMELGRFAYKIDLYYQSVKLSSKTVEVPIVFEKRKKEKSKFNFKEILASYKVVLMLRAYQSKRFIKYGMVGFLGYIINALGLEIFYLAGLPIGLAAALGAELAIVSNFTFNNIWTFREEKITRLSKLFSKFFQFNLSSAGAVLIQALVVSVGTGIFGPDTRQIMLIVAVVCFIVPFNYFVYNAFIWKTWRFGPLERIQKILG